MKSFFIVGEIREIHNQMAPEYEKTQNPKWLNGPNYVEIPDSY